MTIEKALELNINFFDTSPAYGEGNSKKLLGEVASSEPVFFSTKIGRKNLSDKAVWSISAAQDSFLLSTRQLKRDCLDIVFLHSPERNDVGAISNLADWLNERKQRGYIRSWGISLKQPSDWYYFSSLEPDYVQVNLNLLDVRAIEFLEEWDTKHIGIIARTPLASGLLSSFKPLFFTENDHRIDWSLEFKSNLIKIREHIIPESDQIKYPLPKTAFEFVSSFKEVASLVSSFMHPQEVEVAFCSIMQGTLSINQREVLRTLSSEANALFFKE